MSAVGKILFWLLMFGGTHVIGSSVPVRTRVIGAVGLPAFKGLYSVVAFATFIPLWNVYKYNKHAGPLLFAPHDMLDLVAQALMLIALVVIAQGGVTPNPMTPRHKRISRLLKNSSVEARFVAPLSLDVTHRASTQGMCSQCLHPRLGPVFRAAGLRRPKLPGPV